MTADDLNADDQNIVIGSGGDKLIGRGERVNESSAACFQDECGHVFGA